MTTDLRAALRALVPEEEAAVDAVPTAAPVVVIAAVIALPPATPPGRAAVANDGGAVHPPSVLAQGRAALAARRLLVAAAHERYLSRRAVAPVAMPAPERFAPAGAEASTLPPASGAEDRRAYVRLRVGGILRDPATGHAQVWPGAELAKRALDATGKPGQVLRLSDHAVLGGHRGSSGTPTVFLPQARARAPEMVRREEIGAATGEATFGPFDDEL